MTEEENLTKKGKDKQEVADSLKHNATCQKKFVSILGVVVPVKLLTEISIFITLE